MAFNTYKVENLTLAGCQVRVLWHLYNHLINNVGFTLLDWEGDFSSESNLVTYGQTTAAPWFVVQTPSTLLNRSDYGVYWFGATQKTYQAECAFWTLNITQSFFLFAGGPGATWLPDTNIFDVGWGDPRPRTENFTHAATGGSTEYSYDLYISADNDTIILATTDNVGVTYIHYYGMFDSTIYNDQLAFATFMGETITSNTYSLSRFRDIGESSYKPKLALDHMGAWRDICIGVYDNETPMDWTSGSKKGVCQDTSSYFSLPAPIIINSSDQGDGKSIPILWGFCRGLYQGTAAIGESPIPDTDTVNGFIKFDNGYMMNYPTT